MEFRARSWGAPIKIKRITANVFYFRHS
ncbi:MAG: hypothetical protein RIQ83_2419, partial [Pseudomonadota bacterium]